MRIIEDFLDLYRELDADTPKRLGAVYSETVHFKDPVHSVMGLPALQRYFTEVSEHLVFCRFEFLTVEANEHTAFLRWTMSYSHPRLAAGRALALNGASYLRGDEKIEYHEDYYDLGAMVYEHVPILGRLVSHLKHGMSTNR